MAAAELPASQNSVVAARCSSNTYVRAATTVTRLGGKALTLDLVTILGFVKPLHPQNEGVE